MSQEAPQGTENSSLVNQNSMRLCLKGLKFKEDGVVTGIIATTHPDRVGDILGRDALTQMAELINTTDEAGGEIGSYRSVSLYHDWVHQNDPTLDEAGFLKPGSAKVIELDDGHYGVEVEATINEHYRGPIPAEEIKYRIDNGGIAGFSIEYKPDEKSVKNVNFQGKEYRYIPHLTEFAGVGFARARAIANPHAVIYKEVEKTAMEAKQMEENTQAPEMVEAQAPAPVEATAEAPAAAEEATSPTQVASEPAVAEAKETTVKVDIKQLVESKEFKDALAENLHVKSKVAKTRKEESNMNPEQISVKEMNEALGKNDIVSYKEAASAFLKSGSDFDKQLRTTGVSFGEPTLKVKCNGNKLQIVGRIETKDTLDTTTNAGAYTESIVEFNDVFIPGLVDTFNQQTNLFGALRKVDHIAGGDQFGWRIATDQSTSLAVDPDDVSVVKDPVNKLKLHTAIKEYRVGVSVSDFVLWHSRASMGDLFMVEVEKRTRDLLKNINGDLFTEQVDTAGNKILGLEAVADSAGNTSLYGKTRSTANRLAPASAADTYNAVGGALTSGLLRGAMRKVEVEGASRGNLRVIVNPLVRDLIFEIEDGNLRYHNNNAALGFDGQVRYDGVSVIIDPDAQSDALFVVDWESYYIVMSRSPRLIGLAKAGAAEEAYVSVYLAAVYEQPRRIHMLDTLS